MRQVMEEDQLPLTQSLEVEVRTGFAVTTADPALPTLSAEELSEVLSRAKVRSGQSLRGRDVARRRRHK